MRINSFTDFTYYALWEPVTVLMIDTELYRASNQVNTEN